MRQILCIEHRTAFDFLSFDQVIVRKSSKQSSGPDVHSKVSAIRDDARPILRRHGLSGEQGGNKKKVSFHGSDLGSAR